MFIVNDFFLASSDSLLSAANIFENKKNATKKNPNETFIPKAYNQFGEMSPVMKSFCVFFSVNQENNSYEQTNHEKC